MLSQKTQAERRQGNEWTHNFTDHVCSEICKDVKVAGRGRHVTCACSGLDKTPVFYFSILCILYLDTCKKSSTRIFEGATGSLGGWGGKKSVVFLKLQLFAAANHMGKKAPVDDMSEADDTCLSRCLDKEQSIACCNQNRL